MSESWPPYLGFLHPNDWHFDGGISIMYLDWLLWIPYVWWPFTPHPWRPEPAAVRRLATSLHGKDGTLYISLSLFSSLRYTMILQLIFSLWYLWWTFLNGKGWSQHFFFFLTLRGGHFWTARAGQHIFFFCFDPPSVQIYKCLGQRPFMCGFFCLDGTSCQANRVRSESASLRWLVVSTRRTRKLCYILPHASAITRSWWGLAWKPDSLKCYWKLNKMRVAINYTHEIIECSRYSN